jgi:hypothetical protein
MTGFGAGSCAVQVRYDNAGIFASLPDNDARAAALLDSNGNGAPVTVTFTPDKELSAPVSAHWSLQLAHAQLCHAVYDAHQCTAAAEDCSVCWMCIGVRVLRSGQLLPELQEVCIADFAWLKCARVNAASCSAIADVPLCSLQVCS